MFPKIALAAACFTTVILAGCNSSGTATANNPQVEDRAKLMKDWRHANEGMKAMIEDPSRFDAITFKERADFIADTNATMWVHFEGEMAQGGHAKDEIWTDPEGFKAKTEAFTSSINALALAASEAASVADVEASYGEMASQCGSCHKAYKKK